jgi:hypothetical protein
MRATGIPADSAGVVTFTKSETELRRGVGPKVSFQTDRIGLIGSEGRATIAEMDRKSRIHPEGTRLDRIVRRGRRSTGRCQLGRDSGPLMTGTLCAAAIPWPRWGRSASAATGRDGGAHRSSGATDRSPPKQKVRCLIDPGRGHRANAQTGAWTPGGSPTTTVAARPPIPSGTRCEAGGAVPLSVVVTGLTLGIVGTGP